jgi:phosphopantothenoylcysteine synthetase/decarboxylase
MNILVTAGNTQTPIDRVRCITNIFTGRTGMTIAHEACTLGHTVTLCMSPSLADGLFDQLAARVAHRWRLAGYRTFEELHALMAREITSGGFDVIIHAAAINDYESGGIFAPASGTRFDPTTQQWSADAAAPRLFDRAAGKVKSDEPELWLRLVRAPKLVDMIRRDWGFRGTLVKFKLEVGTSDAELLDIAERSRRHSEADWMVANTLDGAAEWAFLGPFADGYHKISRRDLAATLLRTIEGRVD